MNVMDHDIDLSRISAPDLAVAWRIGSKDLYIWYQDIQHALINMLLELEKISVYPDYQYIQHRSGAIELRVSC